jgi:hypothetical protein
MKYVDPVKNPNLWLEMTILKMIEEREPENNQALTAAIKAIVHWLEPGLIDQLFGDWIQVYLNQLDELESSQNNVDPPCSLEPSEE